MQRLFLRALVCAVLLSSLALPALAHSQLLSATPGPGDKVIGPPTELVGQFSQNLDASKTSFEIRDASGARVARGGELGDGPREFRLALPPLDPGVYEVRWTSYSTEDNEVGRDTYTFEVLAAPSPPPTPSAAPSATARPSASPTPAISPTATPGASAPPASLEPGSATSGGASGVDGSVVIPIVVALGAVSIFGLWAFRRPRG